MSSFYCSSIYSTVTQAFHRTPCLCIVPTHSGGHSSISSNILSVHALKLPIVHRLHPRKPPVRPHHCLVYHLHPRSRCLCTLPSLNARDVVAKQSRSLEMASTSTFSPPATTSMRSLLLIKLLTVACHTRCILRIRPTPTWAPEEDATLACLTTHNYHHWHCVADCMSRRSSHR
jgi:hypothetical protein